MSRFVLFVATVALLPLFLGASITMTQPTSGNLTGGHPQQPSGTATGYNQGDTVVISWTNFVQPGQFRFDTVACDEYWTSIDFLNNGWSADTDFSFTASGQWSIVAQLKDANNQNKASTGAGGAVVP